MFEPTNEQGVIVLFSSMMKEVGWEIAEIRTAYPDSILRNKNGLWKTEFEFCSSGFLYHRHDHRECDLIVCWKNDYPCCPIPVIELSSESWTTTEIERCDPHKKEIEYWKRRCLRAEHRLSKTEEKRSEVLDRPDEQSRRLTLYKIIEQEGDIGVPGFMNRLGVRSRTTVYSDLDKLKEKNLIKKNGSGWELNR